MKGTEESKGGERETAKNENVENTKGARSENIKMREGKGNAYEQGSNIDKPFFDAGGMELRPNETKGDLFGQSKDNTCVATSLKMLLNDVGINISEVKLSEALNTTEAGARVIDIPTTVENLGINAKVEKIGSFEQLEKSLNNGNSAVVSVTIPGKGSHALVVDGISNGRVSIRDPYPVGKGSSYNISISDFKSFFNNRAVSISK